MSQEQKKPKKVQKKKRGIRFSTVVLALIGTVGSVLMMPTTIIFIVTNITSSHAMFGQYFDRINNLQINTLPHLLTAVGKRIVAKAHRSWI